ncbi:MAG: lytic transglycosylase domain-containing protein [Pseudomonadota bacterium]
MHGVGRIWCGRRRASLFCIMVLGWLGFLFVQSGKPVMAEQVEQSVQRDLQSGVAIDDFDLPDVLTAADLNRYSLIFALQENAKWREADLLIAGLEDQLLLGHVQFQRYMHPTGYRSKFHELYDWLTHYADHPGAIRIYKLALRRRPADGPIPIKPAAPELPALVKLSKDETRTETPKRSYGPLDLKVRRQLYRHYQAIERSYVTRSLEAIRTQRQQLGACGYALAIGAVARGYYHHALDLKAIAVAEDQGLDWMDHEQVNCYTRLAWWAGLAAWRAGDYAQAGSLFRRVLRHGEWLRDDWMRTRLHFWAARTDLRQGTFHQIRTELATASDFPRTFYGLLAREYLGLDTRYNWDMPQVNASVETALRTVPAFRRAAALVLLGKDQLARQTLDELMDELSPAAEIWLMRFGEALGLAEFTYRLGRQVARRQGMWVDAALYPIPGWASEVAFALPPPLIYAIIRRESAFRTSAISRSGARGLMQLMPATAGFIAGRAFKGKNGRKRLLQPQLNLALGQEYLLHLLESKAIQGDLIKTLASYNAGPGNLVKWQRNVASFDDPLLLIESLKARETRRYVKNVLTNSQVYGQRLGMRQSVFATLSQGDWPKLDLENVLQTL